MSCNHLNDCTRCGKIVDDLERENAELRRDKERLDWLLKQDPPCAVILDYAFDPAWDTIVTLDSRAALDKAMNEDAH